MSTDAVVYDCNTFIQAVASPEGPAGRCVQLAIDQKVDLYISPHVLRELREVTSDTQVVAKLHLIPESVERFILAIELAATALEEFDRVLEYARDPDDAEYVNLAVAAGATLIVSRDRDLLDLMDGSRKDAIIPGEVSDVAHPESG